MTAYATIPVVSVQNVLKIPNTALRYKPPMSAEEILAIYKDHGISDGTSNPGAESTATSAQPTPVTQIAPRAPKSDSVVVWKLRPDNNMEPVRIALGITDHALTEVTAVLKGDLKEGDDVIIRSIVAKPQTLNAIRR
jgi:HlyD family secretion protein